MQISKVRKNCHGVVIGLSMYTLIKTKKAWMKHNILRVETCFRLVLHAPPAGHRSCFLIPISLWVGRKDSADITF